jgi:hypothetical protein
MRILNTISRVEAGENAPERLLWRALIGRAIQEWLSGSQRRHREAEEYLFTDSRQLHRFIPIRKTDREEQQCLDTEYLALIWLSV